MSRHRRRRSVVCQQLVEMVNDYLSGDLDPVEQTAVEAHRSQCDHYAGYVQQVRRMLVLTADAEGEPVKLPADLLDALTSRYRQGSAR
jgi:anti-sigma factor RsiW